MKKHGILKLFVAVSLLCTVLIIWRWEKKSITKFGLSGNEEMSNLRILGANYQLLCVWLLTLLCQRRPRMRTASGWRRPGTVSSARWSCAAWRVWPDITPTPPSTSSWSPATWTARPGWGSWPVLWTTSRWECQVSGTWPQWRLRCQVRHISLDSTFSPPSPLTQLWRSGAVWGSKWPARDSHVLITSRVSSFNKKNSLYQTELFLYTDWHWESQPSERPPEVQSPAQVRWHLDRHRRHLSQASATWQVSIPL